MHDEDNTIEKRRKGSYISLRKEQDSVFRDLFEEGLSHIRAISGMHKDCKCTVANECRDTAKKLETTLIQ